MTTEVSKTPTQRLAEVIRVGPGTRPVADMVLLRMCHMYMKWLEDALAAHEPPEKIDTFYELYRDAMKKERLEAEKLKVQGVLERLKRGAR